MHVHVHVLHVPHVASATEINGKECVWGNHQVNVYKLWPGLMDGVSQSPVVPCPPTIAYGSKYVHANTGQWWSR